MPGVKVLSWETVNCRRCQAQDPRVPRDHLASSGVPARDPRARPALTTVVHVASARTATGQHVQHPSRHGRPNDVLRPWYLDPP